MEFYRESRVGRVRVSAPPRFNRLMPRRRRQATKDTSDLYAILGVPFGADPADIKRAYRALALKHHPDKVAASERKAATERLAQINTAWDTLGDADRR